MTTTKAPLFDKAAAASDKAAREVIKKAPKVLRKAFSTVLCDDGDALPAVVLLMSLLRSGTDAQLVPRPLPAQVPCVWLMCELMLNADRRVVAVSDSCLSVGRCRRV